MLGFNTFKIGNRKASGYGNDMVLQFDTTIAGSSGVGNLTIPAGYVGTYDAVIDWGDGTTSTITSYNDADLSHSYSSAGTYIVKITGSFPNIKFNNGGDKLKLIKVLNLGNVSTSFERSFWGCSNMTEFIVGTTDTSNVTNMYGMFYGCSSLILLDLSNFDTSNVTNMSTMFYGCSSLILLDLSNFDTSNVTNMFAVFGGCSSLTSLDVSSFDTSNVTNMRSMFNGCSSLTSLDVSSFDTSSVTNMRGMFGGCSSLTSLNISSFNIESVTDFTDFVANITIQTSDYDAILNNFASQDAVNGLTIDFGNAKYSSTGADARQSLIDDDSWTIIDGGSI